MNNPNPSSLVTTGSSVKSFASDNYSGAHPRVIEAILKANQGHVPAYGGDVYTVQAIETVRTALEAPEAEVFFVFSGTAANVLALGAAVQRFESVFCSEISHLNRHEGNAPESYLGCKLISFPSHGGKIRPEQIEPYLSYRGDEHMAQPRAISLTQCTEVGTVYSLEELREFAEFAHGNAMFLHVDGARIANAAAYLNVSLKELLVDSGVDVLSLGGTKNAMLGAEAVVFLNPKLAANFSFFRKNAMQLGSKMRFLAAQFLAMYADGLWLECARHSNAMALRLAERLNGLPGLRISQPVQSNAVFATLPAAVIPILQENYPFYTWNEATHEVRWMCSFDTRPADVDQFAGAIRDAFERVSKF